MRLQGIQPPRVTRRRRRRVRRRGAMLLLIAILMVAFLATVALSVDVAYMNMVNSELRASTDAAAKAAMTTLNVTEDVTQARRSAKRIAALNLVAGRPLILEDSDIVFGQVSYQNSGVFQFMPGLKPFGAALIDGRKLRNSPSGSVGLFFGGFLGTSEFNTELKSIAARLDRDVCLVLDRSGSMKGQKLTDLKSAVTAFLQVLADRNSTQEYVGLVTYSTTPTINQKLTSDLNLVKKQMSKITASGWTDIGGGIDTGRSVLGGGHNASLSVKAIVLMTDGVQIVNNDPKAGTQPEAAAARARQQNILIHTITFGTDADKTRMQAVAQITGGTYHHAPDGATLRQVFRDLARTVSTALTQ